VLRGNNTIRLHVKKFKALQKILEAVCKVEAHPDIEFSKISIPLSMKNQFQKKGFLVYLQLTDVKMVAPAREIFQQYEEFKKCDVAHHANSRVETPTPSPAPEQTEPAPIPPVFEEEVDQVPEPGAVEDLTNEDEAHPLQPISFNVSTEPVSINDDTKPNVFDIFPLPVMLPKLSIDGM